MHTITAVLRVVGLAAALPAIAAASDVPVNVEAYLERLIALEKRVAELANENQVLREQLRAPADANATPADVAAAKPVVAVQPAGKEKSLKLGGYMQAHAEFGDAPDARWNGLRDRFLVRRARLGVTGAFAEDMGFKLEADFGNNSVSGRSGYSAQITDAVVTWTPHTAATVRLGQFKTPFGYEQLLPDTKTPLAERSLPNDRLTVSRQIGAGLSGEFGEEAVAYSIGMFNGNGTNNGANDNDDFLWAGRLAGSIFTNDTVALTGGINAFVTESTGTFVGQRQGQGIDLQFASGPVTVVTEWLRNDFDPATGAEFSANGWSALAGYRFAPRWQGVVRFETYDSNSTTTGTTSDLWTFGVNYYIKGDDLKVSLNYLRGEPAGSGSSQDRVIGRMQVVF